MLQPSVVATKVLCLTEVVSPEELNDDDDYEDILEDMKIECGKFGNLLQQPLDLYNSRTFNVHNLHLH